VEYSCNLNDLSAPRDEAFGTAKEVKTKNYINE
jgi:hypothetical protein